MQYSFDLERVAKSYSVLLIHVLLGRVTCRLSDNNNIMNVLVSVAAQSSLAGLGR